MTHKAKELLRGGYALSSSQQKVFDDFASLLSNYDPQLVQQILVDVQAAAQEKTHLADYFGTEG